MRKFLMALGFSALALTSVSSCDFDSLVKGDEFTQCLGINNANDILTGLVNVSMDAQNCPRFDALYQQTVKQEGELLSIEEVNQMIRDDADFSMAISLNATGVKKLFDQSVSWANQFPVVIDVGGCRDRSASVIDKGLQVENCLAFGFNIKGYNVIFGVPMTSVIKRDGQDGQGDRTSVFASLQSAQIIELTGNSFADYALESVIHAAFDKYLKDVHLFDIAAWNIGNGDVKLFAGAPKVQIDSATGYKALEFGMYSNLYYAQRDAVNIARDMPQEAQIGLHIHPDLIRAIIGRMMTETKSEDPEDTYITRKVMLDESATSVSQTGGFHVTLTNIAENYPEARLMACSADWRNYFTLGFRLWSTESFCGYMDILAGFKIELSNSKFSIGVGNIHGGLSEGAMSVTNGVFNSIVTTDFFKGLLDYTNISVNFNEFTVNNADGTNRKADLSSDSIRFGLNGSGINLYLNFLNM